MGPAHIRAGLRVLRRHLRYAGGNPRKLLWVVRRAVSLAREGAIGGVLERHVAEDGHYADYAQWCTDYEPTAAGFAGRLAALKQRPLISILLPVWNPPAEFLQAALASVQAQCYPDWELCIVDDASTDANVRAVLDAATTDPRIRLLRRDGNGGIAVATNDALHAARGHYCAFLDHDDTLAPDALLTVIEAMDLAPGTAMLFSDEDKLDREATRKVIRRSWQFAAPYRPTIRLALVLVTLWTGTTLAGPVLVSYGIDHGISAGNAGKLNLAVGGYIAATIAAYVLARFQFVAINRAGEGFLRDLRVRVFDHLQKQGLAYFDREKTGVLVSRMTADIESMAELIQFGLLQFISAGMLVLMALVLLFVLSWQLTLLALVVFPIIVIASIKFQRDSNKAYLQVRERVGNNLSALQEGISGVRVIQAFAREDEQSRRFHESNRSLFDGHMHSVKVSMWYFALVEFCGIVAIASMVGVGGWMVHRGSVSLGVVTAFVLLLGSLFEPVQQLSQLYNTVQSAGASLQKLYGILDTVPEVDEAPDAVVLPAVGKLAVVEAGFEYVPGRPVLTDVTLTVGVGERLALVGPTGAGKSTLAKLMARLYDPTNGTVSFGGVDLRDATLESLRQRVVVVPQEGFLFSGSIRDNLAIARPSATDAEILESLAAIGVLDHFLAFPEGLDTEVRERGSRLSAGERQLIALARAALVDPAVLVLDEATSNLDPGTEAEVEHALESLMLDRTVIVVAHRLSTVRRADRIAVVDAGGLLELGSHDELVALGGKYAALSAAWQRNQVAS